MVVFGRCGWIGNKCRGEFRCKPRKQARYVVLDRVNRGDGVFGYWIVSGTIIPRIDPVYNLLFAAIHIIIIIIYRILTICPTEI